MADRKIFSFSLEGIDAIADALDDFTDEFELRLGETMMKLANKVIHDAKRLAPLDEGDLEAALVVGEIYSFYGHMYIDMGTSIETDDYAVVQHEGFRKTKGGKIVTFTPGEKTVSKGAYNGELPGKKFLERALKMNEKLIIEELSKIFKG